MAILAEWLGSGELVLYAGYISSFFAIYLLANMLMREEESRAAQEALEDMGEDRQASSGLVRVARPFFTNYVVPMIRGKKVWAKQRSKFRGRLVTAGLKQDFTPDEFISFKFFLILFFPVIGGVLKILDLIDVSNTQILLSGVAGYFYPDFWMNSRIKMRQKQVKRALPFIVDLLALSTEAGLDFLGAIGKVVEKAAPSPLVDEFDQMMKEIKVGASRQEALRDMATRLNMTEINSFVAILISADNTGASIGKILRQQSETIRGERFVMAEKEGAKAAPKLIMVTALFILPAVLLMVAAPFILSFVQGGQL